jgi:hypothetical protein
MFTLYIRCLSCSVILNSCLVQRMTFPVLFFTFLSPSRRSLHIWSQKKSQSLVVLRVCGRVEFSVLSFRSVPMWPNFLNFWHRSFTFNSNKSPTWCNSFSVYYPDVCLQLNMFRAFSRPSSGAQTLQWQPLVLPSYRGNSRDVFVVGPAGLTTNTERLSPRYENKTRGCHCSH